MTNKTKKLLEQGKEHIEGAKILMSYGYPTDITGLLFHQALEAYFKGLLANWQLDPKEDENLKTLFNPECNK